MPNNKAMDEFKVMSRRTVIKGAAAAALAGGLMARQGEAQDQEKTQDPKGKEKAKGLAQGCNPTDHTGMLGIWLALVRDGRYCDRGIQAGRPIGTWDPNIAPADLAKTLVDDLNPNLPSLQHDQALTAVKQFIQQLRTRNPMAFSSYRDLYTAVGDDLMNLSTNAYGGGDCPKFYATVQAIAKVKP